MRRKLAAASAAAAIALGGAGTAGAAQREEMANALADELRGADATKIAQAMGEAEESMRLAYQRGERPTRGTMDRLLAAARVSEAELEQAFEAMSKRARERRAMEAEASLR